LWQKIPICQVYGAAWLKQLKPVTNNPQIYQLVQERFQREAAILEQLGDGSDCIPSLYAYFPDGGLFYLVQEWIDGETLTQKVQQHGTLTESAVKDILTNLLPVLDYVHSNRIVHRDIKPDNIILRRRDGKPVLIDFGAVRETMATVVTTGGNATKSIVIGTPGYMPPEQAAGRPVYSSDLYSLGLTAIHLLTGKEPQELETDYHTGEIIWRHNSNVSPSLADVLDKAIHSHHLHRYSTARDMLNALQPGAAPLPLTEASFQQPEAPPPQPSPPPERQDNKFNTAITSSLIAGGLIGASVIVGLAINQSQPSTQTTSTPTPATPQSAPPSPVASVSSPEIKQPIQAEISPSPSTPVAKPMALPRHAALSQVKASPRGSSFYFVATYAAESSSDASQKVESLQAQGYSQAGMFWIPDYPNLSGKRFFNVYPARFSSRQSCAEFLNSYSNREPGAYCAKASKNRNVSADRFYAR